MQSAIVKLSLVLLLAVPLIGGTRPVPQATTRRIDIDAKRFSYQPNEITLKKGQPVTLVFHSQDVTHGFESEDMHVKVEIPKRGTTQVTLVPKEAGEFSGKCSHFCGAGHGQMQMTIHVTE